MRTAMGATGMEASDPKQSRADGPGLAENFDFGRPGLPPPSGLFDPRVEHDACGVGFIADIKGRKSHKIVEDALTILLNLEHRGAVGADPRAGDGAGILVQIPHAFFAKRTAELGFRLPPPGGYGVGFLFMPQDAEWRQVIHDIYADMVPREGLRLLGWREVPSDNSTLGESVKPTEPKHMQVFIGQGERGMAITRSRSPAAPSSTKACSSPTSSRPTTPTCTIRIS
jgi:glutamate synthase domain-containing protein 1